MAEHSFPWASIDGDRVYSAENFASHFAAVLTNGVFPVGDQLQVTAGEGMAVSVSPGRAWINGYSYVNTAAHTLSIDAADGVLNRIDRIVIRWSRIDRAIFLAVLKGAPASTPVAPSVVRDADYHDLSLATVTVPAGITAIVGGHISDTRLDTDVCGIASSLITPETDGWYDQWETEFTTWMSAEQGDLEAWLSTIQGLVDGETASQLAGAIASTDNVVSTHLSASNPHDITPNKINAQTQKLVFTDVTVLNFAEYTASDDEETALFDAGFTNRGSATLTGVTAGTYLDVLFGYMDRISGKIGGAASYNNGVYVYSKAADNITIPLIVGWN